MAKKKRSTTSVAKKSNAMKRVAVQARATKKSGAMQLCGVRRKVNARAAAHQLLTHVDARGRAAMVDVGQ